MEAIWTFGRVFFGADRRRDHRLDQSVVSVLSSEPSETCEASNRSKRSDRKKDAAQLIIQEAKLS